MKRAVLRVGLVLGAMLLMTAGLPACGGSSEVEVRRGTGIDEGIGGGGARGPRGTRPDGPRAPGSNRIGASGLR